VTFRCSAAAQARGDSLAGTASTVRSFLLVENPGPWGVDALVDSRLPEQVMGPLRRSAAQAKVRLLLIRRYHRSAPRRGFRVYAGWAGPREPWLESAVLDEPADLLGLAERIDRLGAGTSMGLAAVDEPKFFACTHGRHDACCAERGRPVAAALDAALPGSAWEVSHMGGDRFAANALVLPFGLYLGRLTPESAVPAAQEVLAGRLPLDVLRGRSCLPMPVQFAEIELLRRLHETRIGAVQVTGIRRDGELTSVTLQHAHDTWRATVRTTRPDTGQLTCRAARESPVPRHELLDLDHA